jgi:hypothetical protein
VAAEPPAVDASNAQPSRFINKQLSQISLSNLFISL